MVNVDKIRELSREQGIKLCFLSQKIGVQHTYFANAKNKHQDIPDSRLSIVADILNTTVAYLRDETDIKEKPSATHDVSQKEATLKAYEAIIQNPRITELLSVVKDASTEDIERAIDIIKVLKKHSNM